MAQHQAVQIRLTPAIKQALLQAQASGLSVSLSVPNLGAPVPSSDVRGQAILRVGDQEHVFHMAREPQTSALVRLPRSPVHPGAPVTSTAQVTAKLKPQQTLDQGTKERVRALGQEAAAKQKQRAAVMLNGKAAERAATGKPAVTKTVRQATPPPPPAPAVTPFAAAHQPSQQQQQQPAQVQRRAISPPATTGASTGATATVAPVPKQRPVSASTPPPPAAAATPPPAGGEKGGGSTGGPPGASTASGAAAVELPPAAILAAKERALELVIVAIMGNDRAVSNTGLYQRVDAAYKAGAQKMESREHLKRVVDMLTERVPPNRLKLKQSALDQYQPRLAALQSKAGASAGAGGGGGDKASERPPLAPSSAADKAGPSRKRPAPAGDSTGAAAGAGPGQASAKAAGAGGAAAGVKRPKLSKEADTPGGDGTAAVNASGPAKKKKKTMSLNAANQTGTNEETAKGVSGASGNGAKDARDGAGPAAKKQKTGPGPSAAGDKAKKGAANGTVKGKAVVEKKNGSAGGAAPAAAGDSATNGGAAGGGPGSQAGAGKEGGPEPGGGGAAAAGTQPASDQQPPVRKGGSKKKPKASFRQLGISNWEEDEEDQQGYAGLQARQKQHGYNPYRVGWAAAGGSASAPAALVGGLDKLGSGGLSVGGLSQGAGADHGEGEHEEEEWEVEEDGDWQAIQWGAAPTPQAGQNGEEEQQAVGGEDTRGGGLAIPQPPPPPVPPAKGGVPVGEVAAEAGRSQPSPSPAPVIPSPTSVLPVPEYVDPPAPGIQLPPMPPAPPIQLPTLLAVASRNGTTRSRGATPAEAGARGKAKAGALAAPVKGGALGAGVQEECDEECDEGEDELWERVEVLEDDPADREVYARYINWQPPPPGSYSPISSPEEHAALEKDFKDKYNAYYMAHQKYNSVMRKLEALRESADTAAAQGDPRLSSLLHRQLWLEAACNYVLLRTWQRVVSALESDLNTLRGLAADYVSRTAAGAGHSLPGAGQPPRMAGGRTVRVA